MDVRRYKTNSLPQRRKVREVILLGSRRLTHPTKYCRCVIAAEGKGIIQNVLHF